MLVAWGCRKADEMGLKVLYEAETQAEGDWLIRREGFVEVDHVKVDLKPWGGKEGDLYWRRMLLRDCRSRESA